MAVSQNGWPVNPPRRSRRVPGTVDVRVTVADGPAGDVLIWVASQIDRRVESLDLDSTWGELDDWGYASRPIRGGTVTSNHASATAIDVNATRHPLGVRGTFTRAQVGEIHQILAEVDHVVRWGGDYSGRVDEMHFEINARADRVAAVAARLSTEEEEMSAAEVKRILGAIDTNMRYTVRYLSNGDPSRPWEGYTIKRLSGQVAALTAAVAADRDIDPDELGRRLDAAVAAHMPTAEDTVAALLPVLRDALGTVLGEDNAAQADAIVDELVSRLANTNNTEEN